MAHIPQESRFYAFCYPTINPKGEDGFSPVELESIGVNPRDPFVQFMTLGAFVYFDFEYNIVAINACCFDIILEEERATNPSKNEPAMMFFAGLDVLRYKIVYVGS